MVVFKELVKTCAKVLVGGPIQFRWWYIWMKPLSLSWNQTWITCWKKFRLGIGMGCHQWKLKHPVCILFFFKTYFYTVHNPEISFCILLEYNSVLPISHHISECRCPFSQMQLLLTYAVILSAIPVFLASFWVTVSITLLVLWKLPFFTLKFAMQKYNFFFWAVGW